MSAVLEKHSGRPAGAACADEMAIQSGPSLAHPKAVAPAYALLTFHDDGVLKRRNLYLSLHSAVKAQERAEGRGDSFELMLVELVPVASLPLVVVGGDRG
ncbi:hypothetical protein GCM10027596_35750 [Nocardioides korecus]